MKEQVTIDRDELFGDEIDRALAKRRAALGSSIPQAPEISKLRRLLYSNLFYLPMAAVLGALLVWLLLEPELQDFPVVSGQVELVNDDPFNAEGYTTVTVGDIEVYLGFETDFEEGANGQPALSSRFDIKVGDYIEVAGIQASANEVLAIHARLTTEEEAAEIGTTIPDSELSFFLLFPLTGLFIALFVLFAEGVASRNWSRMVPRMFFGGLLATVFSLIAFLPAGLAIWLSRAFIDLESGGIEDLDTFSFVLLSAGRSIAWAVIGAGLGVGMNMVQSTGIQRRNAMLGGALGGAFGGLFFDSLDRFFITSNFADAAIPRLIGLLAVGLAIGLFMALVDRFARTAWLSVKTGPLAGKAFVLYRTPTTIGSSPDAHIYLFKDAEIDAVHAQIHQIGSTFEVEDLGSRHGTTVAGSTVRRRRLVSGDQITIGNTVVEFEERRKQSPHNT